MIPQARKCLCLFALVVILLPVPAWGQERLRVAVASSFMQVFSELAQRYEEKRGVALEPVFASTGSLYNQIKNGAPYDLFLSADEERPRRLLKEGLAGEPFIYARGNVVLWSADRRFCTEERWQDALAGGSGRIALTNPTLAPYGAVVQDALKTMELERSITDRIVTARTVAQAFQYSSTGAVEAGFIVYSAVLTPEGQKGCYYQLPEVEPVVQAGTVLARTENRESAERFAAFLLSDEALTIRERFGYQ